MTRLLLAFALTFALTAKPARAAEVSCLEHSAGSAHAQLQSSAASASNNTAKANPFDQFDQNDWEDVPCVEGLLRGAIVAGDYQKIVNLFRVGHPLLRRFSLISPGGSVEEAIRIGRLFRKYVITATAPHRLLNGSFEASGPHASMLCSGSSECVCASACALTWFGAVDRWGTVGLHRPHTDEPAFRTMTPSEASIAYRRILDGIRKYLDEMEVPKQMIETMVATGSAEIRWIDATEDKVGRPHCRMGGGLLWAFYR
jgi:hypothetical protein